MKYNVITAAFIFLLGFSSCINDESTLAHVALPELQIAGSGSTTMPVFNFNLGDECVITPEITYKGGKEEELKYEWSVGTYQENNKGNLQVVSTERNLRYNFEQGGTYYAHLKVTDGKVGQVVEYQININRTFERGFMLVSNDETGRGNLAFVKDMTPEEIQAGKPQVIMEHCIERMNEGVKETRLVDALHVSFIISFPQEAHRVMIAMEDRCLFVDPNTFTVLSNLPYSEVHSNFKATHFVPDTYAPYVYDVNSKKFVHMNLKQMFAYESGSFKNKSFEDILIAKYQMWGSTYTMPCFFQYSTNELYSYNMNTGFYSSGNLFGSEEIISTFFGDLDETTYSPMQYVLTRLNGQDNRYCLWSIMSILDYANGKEPKIQKTNIEDNQHLALPEKGAYLAYSPTYKRFYFAKGNHVYVCLPTMANPFPSESDFALEFAADEEVTYLDVNMDSEELYLATYNKTNKRGSFYIYDVKEVRTDNKNATPKKVYKDCADRITSIMYKPSI